MGFTGKFLGWVKACVTTPMFSVLINGSPTGYFKGDRGIRQGDPLSPYLFTIPMEAFSGIIRRLEVDGQIKLLPRCKALHLSHLIFADDLMIFVKANCESVLASLGGLDEFAGLSGLHLNRSKSSIIVGGLTQTSSMELSELMGFSETTLPIRYLGVPLVSGRLSLKDCSPILDLVRRKLEGWKARFLSYAGRLQLISSVLQGCYIYWAGIFGLPGNLISQLESMFFNFLWSSPSLERKMHFISCDAVCKPKTEGGLGLKRVKEMNVAAHHALVKEIVRDGDWLPGPSTSFDLIDVWRALPSIDKLHGDNPDLVVWTGNPTGIFSTKSAWNATRVKANLVDWSEAVWFEGSIKSHSFVSWRCLVDALPTRDNLLHRGIPVQHSCEFCWAGIESKNHIFFACPFSIDIWRRIFGMCSLHGQAPMNIFDAAIWVRYAAGRAGSLGVVLKLAFCATVKHIWFERNFRIFWQKARSKDQIVEAIKGDVRTIVTSGSLSGDPTANSHIASAWNLQVHWAIRMPRPCSWFLPPNNLWSLHCDGSLSDGRAAFGGVIRNAIGQP
ncbi:uncharacterized protein LOC122647851, partial [Telopea speciosissima]|uniref:uncharacterized protein LOC122647851 n=1 Tax=Telopea speciosissima TaxID=54955 RepID=UPI001CC3D293